MAIDVVRILEGNTFVVSDERGDIEASSMDPTGLFSYDTRFLSTWTLTVDGERLNALSTDDLQYYEAQFFLVPGTGTVYANADLPEGAVDRDAYVVCVLEQLFGALKRRDIFASPSHRWSDPRARLLQGKGWEAVREDVLAGLSLDEDAEWHLRELVDVLDATWKQMAERLEEAGDDAKISI